MSYSVGERQNITGFPYDSSWPQVATDQNPEEIILMTVREKFLDYFKKEIPYTLKFSIEHWDVTETGEFLEQK